MESLGRTWLRRPDLLDESSLNAKDRALLDSFRSRFMRGLDEPDGDA
jgi:tRNA (guanine37-N1)-methyltransferase